MGEGIREVCVEGGVERARVRACALARVRAHVRACAFVRACACTCAGVRREQATEVSGRVMLTGVYRQDGDARGSEPEKSIGI